LVLAGPGVKQSFSTANQRFPYERIELRLLNGPFDRLDGIWTFDRLGDEGCKITLDLSFELNNGLLDQAFGRLFGLAADKLVTAFTDQLDRQYERL
jgi:ribosome-associated toxin RatA of RatAB toxin-antitoxin module